MATRKKYSTLGLAAAIERGAKKRPKCVGNLFTLGDSNEGPPPLGASCAMGAAYEGKFGTPPVKKVRDIYDPYYQANGGDTQMWRRLRKAFPVLRKDVENPNGSVYALSSVIVNLNDEYGWTRQRIAWWLRTLGRV